MAGWLRNMVPDEKDPQKIKKKVNLSPRIKSVAFTTTTSALIGNWWTSCPEGQPRVQLPQEEQTLVGSSLSQLTSPIWPLLKALVKTAVYWKIL